MDIIIKNGRIIDPSQSIDATGDIAIDKGKVAGVGGTVRSKAKHTIDASGMIVSPGFVDMHTHLREPGREDVETIETGLAAAVAGGFTTVCAMPNTDPPCDSQAHVKYLLERAERIGLSRILPIGTITKKREGSELSEMAELRAAGCPAVSDDGDSVPEAGLMRRALEYASMLDLVIISHCEDKDLAGDGVMHEGYWSTVLGMAPIPAAAESIIVERDVHLAELAGARLHIAHISAGESVETVRQAKKRGVKVTAEATPHHFTLADEDLKEYDTRMKVNPPLRSTEDIKAIKKGLKDGTIDAIATDHAPHPENEKEKEFDYAPFGMIGLETALSLSFLKLVEEGYLDWPGLIMKLSTAPAGILGCGGTLKEGAPADITVIDPGKEWTCAREGINTRSVNSPFIGWKLRAKAEHVIVGGRVVVRGGKLA